MAVLESRRNSLRWLAAGAAAAVLPAATQAQSGAPSGAQSHAASDAQSRAHSTARRTVAVHSEFGALRSAIVHDGSNARSFTIEQQRKLIAPDMLRAHPETAASSREKLIAQQQKLRELLVANGVTLLEPRTEPTMPYQVFARDPAFAIGPTLYVASLKDPWRHDEINGLRDLRSQFPRVVSLASSQAAIEGGDLMVLEGGRVLVGMNRNTDEAGYRALASTSGVAEYELLRVPHHALHLDCCLAPLPDGTALYSLAQLPESSVRLLQRVFEKMIPLDLEEAALQLAANLFWLDAARVISGVRAVKTNALLRRRGFQVIELDYSELIALWGSFRCAVCPVERSTTS